MALGAQITTSTVNLVNADLLAKTRGLRITESTVPSEGQVRPCPPLLAFLLRAHHARGHRFNTPPNLCKMQSMVQQ